MKYDCDVAIIGAGITGCHLAQGLIKGGVNVKIFEAAKSLKEDSGIVSRKIDNFLSKKVRTKFIEAEIDQMSLVSPSGIIAKLKSETPYAFVLNRSRLIRYLRSEIKNNLNFEKVMSLNVSKDLAEIITNEGVCHAKLVVGADGTFSTVRKSAGIKSPKTAFGLLTRSKKLNLETRVYFNKHFSPDWFGWWIPPTGEYGIIAEKRSKEYFDYFQKTLGFQPSETFGAAIPLDYTKSYFNRGLLVGEAAGQVKPITGGGWIFGLTAANHAKRIISDSLELGRFDENFLSFYEYYWKRDFGKEIKKQRLVRKFYSKLTNKQIDAAMKILGPELEKVNNFDYDHMSSIALRIPKLKILKALFHLLKFN